MEGDKARTGGARVLVSSDGRWVRPVMCADCFFAEWPTGGVAPRDRASAHGRRWLLQASGTLRDCQPDLGALADRVPRHVWMRLRRATLTRP